MFFKSKKKKQDWITILFILIFLVFPVNVSATPGFLQTASRSGFWGNDFPDTFITLHNLYYYWADEFADNRGNKINVDKTTVTMTISRLLKAWHFGKNNQFQYIFEGIFIFQDISIDTKSPNLWDGASGIGDPVNYQSIGWNNISKTTHLTFGCMTMFPIGDDDLRLIGDDSYKIMPILGWQQRTDKIWIDIAIGYFHTFDDRIDYDTHQKDYFEYNIMLSYHIKSWNLFVQGDYKDTRQSKIYSVHQNDDGYNYAIGIGITCSVTSQMELSLKYVTDIDGKNELQGEGLNFRFMWFF